VVGSTALFTFTLQCSAQPFFEVIHAMVLGSAPVYFGAATASTLFSTHLL